ncbi:MAG TPA: hypothetical protein VMQ45_08420 [Burkholderiaceae bacterium]|nr:hypothetical protein [Burkholderiaceae bacterium]
MTHVREVLRLTILGATLFLIPAIALAQAGLSVITFDAPGAGTSGASCLLQGTFPYQINGEGEIGGNFQDANNVLHGFLRTRDGAVRPFDAPGAGTGACQGTQGFAINSEGAIAGVTIDASYVYHGMLRERDGAITVFDAPGAAPPVGTLALSVNRDGATTGWYLDASNVAHGFLRDRDGAITTFDAPGAFTIADCINADGAITGYYFDANSVAHGFLRAPDGAVSTFDAPGAGTGPPDPTGLAQGTGGSGINQKGAIVGGYSDANYMNHGFLRAPDGSFTTFDVPGAGTGSTQGTLPSGFAGINAEGEITGAYVDAKNVSHGFLRAPDGAISTFDAPGAGTGASQGTFPLGINSKGTITGYYVDAKNVGHGFLRTGRRCHEDGQDRRGNCEE